MAGKSHVVDAPAGPLVVLAKELNRTSELVEQAEEKLKGLKAQEAAAEKKLVDQMITEQVTSFRTPFGGFRTEAVCYPNVTDREALTASLRRNKKWKALLKETIHGGTLKSLVKELLVAGDKLPDGVEPYTATEIRRFK